MPEQTVANNSVDAPGLTAAKLRAMARTVEDYVQPDAFDLYGHDLPDQEQAYILDRRAAHKALFKGLESWQYDLITRHSPELDRKLLIVPRRRLEEMYRALKAQGRDVRLEPRYGAPAPADPPPAGDAV
jgi:hypothetical protein